MSAPPDNNRAGFTLVEIVITLLVAVILGGLMVQYLVGSLARSTTPMKRLSADTALHAVADNVIGAFRQTAPSDSTAWINFQAGIGAAGTDQNNAYGAYRVLANTYIQFDASGIEQTDSYGTAPENILKIVIAGPDGDPLTFLLIR